MMGRIRIAGLSVVLLLFVLLVASTQSRAAKPQVGRVKPPVVLGKVTRTAATVWTLAMDGHRVAYASGGMVYVWNVETGATSVIKGTYSNAAHTDNAAEIAIAGTRVAWIKRQELGNTEQPTRLYTAPVGGSATRLRKVLGYRDLACGPGGSQIAGAVGSGSSLAVSTWQWTGSGNDVPVAAHQRLNLITPTGLRAINKTPSAIVSASADDGHIAVVPLPKPTWNPEAYCDWATPTSVSVYSVAGRLLRHIQTGNPVAQVALSQGRQGLLVVLSASKQPTFAVYRWRTGELLHTWPVAGRLFDFAVARWLAVYSTVTPPHHQNVKTLHLLNLYTGKDVVIGTTRNGVDRDLAFERRGLVYTINPYATTAGRDTRPGKLVFLPMTKLLASLK